MTRGGVFSYDPADLIFIKFRANYRIPYHLLGKRTKVLDMVTKMTQLGSPAMTESKNQTWVQTERSAHEAWSRLVRNHASAAALLHVLVAHMDHQAAVIASRATLAAMIECSEATIKRAVAVLKKERWVEVVQVGGKGGVNAYVINSRVAWADNRSRLPGAIFTATVIASRAEQAHIDTTPLRRIPALQPGERQLPTGPGSLPDTGPDYDLPSIRIDPETGEITGIADKDSLTIIR
jgi:hypothetical protein